MMKHLFENIEKMLNASNNRPILWNASKERSPVTQSRSGELESPNVKRTSLDETFRKLDDVVDVGNTQFTVGEVIHEVTSKVCSEFCHVHHSKHPETGDIAPELSQKDVNKEGTYCESVRGEGDKYAEVVCNVLPAVHMEASGDKGEDVNGQEGEANKDNGEREQGSLGKGLHEHEASQVHEHEPEASLISEEAEDGDKNRDRSVSKRSLKSSSKVIFGDYVGNRRSRVLKVVDTKLINWIRVWCAARGR